MQYAWNKFTQDINLLKTFSRHSKYANNPCWTNNAFIYLFFFFLSHHLSDVCGSLHWWNTPSRKGIKTNDTSIKIDMSPWMQYFSISTMCHCYEHTDLSDFDDNSFWVSNEVTQLLFIAVSCMLPILYVIFFIIWSQWLACMTSLQSYILPFKPLVLW